MKRGQPGSYVFPQSLSRETKSGKVTREDWMEMQVCDEVIDIAFLPQAAQHATISHPPPATTPPRQASTCQKQLSPHPHSLYIRLSDCVS